MDDFFYCEGVICKPSGWDTSLGYETSCKQMGVPYTPYDWVQGCIKNGFATMTVEDKEGNEFRVNCKDVKPLRKIMKVTYS